MTISNIKVVLFSSKPTNSNVYFKLQTQNVFVSRVTQEERIAEEITLNSPVDKEITFEIWSYLPHKLIKSWQIESSHLLDRHKKYEIKDGQWNILFEKIELEEKHLNKQNRISKQNKKNSCSKHQSLADKKKSRNSSHYKQFNVAILKKNKDKAGIKKALKQTIQCLIKQEKEIKKVDDYGSQRNLYAKTAICSPNVKLLSGLKNQSVLFSDYGFNSSEFNKQFAAKQLEIIENEENEVFIKPEKKKKSKIR